MDEKEYLKKAHKILMKTLVEFDRVCTENNLRYYLICGSLLGAVRNKELIPWDDDVDVAMPRSDFDKLKKIAPQVWNNDEYLFVDYNELGKGVFLDYMTRLVYMKEEVPVNIFRKIHGKGREDIDDHLPIDIYVLENASDEEKEHKRTTMIIQGLYGLAMGHRSVINYDEYKTETEKRQKLIRVISKIGRFIPLSLIFWLYEKSRKKYEGIEGNDYYESNGWIYCIPWRFPKKWFEEGIRIEVSGHMIMAPKNYDAFLKKHYGKNYMIPPAENKRKPSHSAASSGVFQA